MGNCVLERCLQLQGRSEQDEGMVRLYRQVTQKGAYRICFRQMGLMNKKTALFRTRMILPLEGHCSCEKKWALRAVLQRFCFVSPLLYI
jgi:hypothetical protein